MTTEALKLASLALINTGTEYESAQWELELQALDAIDEALAAPAAAELKPPATFDLTEARAIVIDAIRRMRAGHVDCHDLTMKAEDFLQSTHAAAKSDALWDQTLRERDHYHEVANKLAQAIATYFGVDIGEHSSANCPWDEALEAISQAPTPQPVRKPLTNEQIEDLCGESNRGFCIDLSDYTEAVRAAERAHGITKEGAQP